MFERNIVVVCELLISIILVCLISSFATIFGEPLGPKTIIAALLIIGFTLIAYRHLIRLWVTTRGDLPRFNTPDYGLVRGIRYNTLAVHEKGDSYYAMVEAMDGPTKGIIRTVNFGDDQPPSEFVYHGDRTIITLGTA
ncbi:hypothetical protein K2Q08_01865 [Patescibacteria group bacterium]|nr:hypothetical protein [Patescibacteria group bacterium]